MMKITEIRIKNYRQFQNFHLSLRHPQTQEPLEKVCFIGANGTGKSTLLRILSGFLQSNFRTAFSDFEKPWIRLDFQNSSSSLYAIFKPFNNPASINYTEILLFPEEEAVNQVWAKLATTEEPEIMRQAYEKYHQFTASTLIELSLKSDNCDLVIYAPPDGSSKLQQDIPPTSLNNALGFFQVMPAYHEVSYEDVVGFWNVLIYQIKKRESDFQTFLKLPENQDKTVAEVRQLFDQRYPEILTELAKQWNFILERAGLEFDLENAKIPVQLYDNLLAYVRARNSPNQPISYNLLSTGIRNFIFRLGHIYSLYFNRHIERGFLLIDEPELSLFPDLLYDIIDRYLAITQNTQLFVATHSPIIAAQFEPFERIILEFDSQGCVTPRTGISPAGDDPNDLLVNDFMVRSLYGRKGVEQWYRFLELRRLIHNAESLEHKKILLDEYMKIGNAYNFAPDEIPS